MVDKKKKTGKHRTSSSVRPITVKDHDHSLSGGLRAALGITRTLIDCDDFDELCRLAVELPRKHLGIDRTGLLLVDGDRMQGTYGTDLNGSTIDERDMIFPREDWWEEFTQLRDEAQLRARVATLHSAEYWENGQRKHEPKAHQVLSLPLQSGDKPLGIFSADNAITGMKMNEMIVDVVSVYGSILSEILARRQTDEMLRLRERYLTGLNDATNLLLQEYGMPDYQAFLNRLAPHTRADRTYVFLNRREPDGRLYASQVAEWHAPSVSAEIENPHTQHVAYADYLPRWEEVLGSGNIINQVVENLPASEVEFLKKQGIRSILIIPIMVAGNFEGFIGFDNCQVEQKWGEAEQALLRAASDDLAQAIARQRTEEQLQQAQKMEAVGQLAGGVAHDFNNILMVISGNLELALDDLDPSHPLKTLLEEAANASQRGASLVEQLLLFGRKQILRPRILDLNEVITHVARMLDRLLGEQIQIHIQPAARLHRIHADQTMLEQVIMNLCINARDAMDTCGDLTIATANACFSDEFCVRNTWATPGTYAMVSVEDNGCGMTEQTLSRIFEPFFSTKETKKGTGLGLSSAYGIVRQHDGLIHAQSQFGVGSRFEVYFPATRENNRVQDDEPSEVSLSEKETILLAEDDEAVRKLTKRLLEKAGYHVLTAADGEEALHIFREQHKAIHLLLLDVVMPRLGGREFYERIVAAHPNFPAIFVSGYADVDIHSRFLKSTGLPHLKKPYLPKNLLVEIRQILDKRISQIRAV